MAYSDHKITIAELNFPEIKSMHLPQILPPFKEVLFNGEMVKSCFKDTDSKISWMCPFITYCVAVFRSLTRTFACRLTFL